MSRIRSWAALATIPIVGAIFVVAPAASASAPAGSTIVWSRFSTHFRHASIVGYVDGEFRVLTRAPAGAVDVNAHVSPDGQHILFERELQRPEETVNIGIVGIDGRGERLLDLGCTAPCVGDTDATFTPDGQHLVWTRVLGPFESAGNGSAASAVLYRARLDGSDRHRLSPAGIDGDYEDYHAEFAPGGYIVFLRLRNRDIKPAVFRMNPDGTHVRQLTPYYLGADLPDISPATSGPTRDLITFETYGTGAPEGLSQAVATVPATCHPLADCKAQIRQLTPSDDPLVANFNPVWSPDGKRIAFCHFTIGSDSIGGDIWSTDYRGNHRQIVSDDARFEFRPDWGVAPTG